MYINTAVREKISIGNRRKAPFAGAVPVERLEDRLSATPRDFRRVGVHLEDAADAGGASREGNLEQSPRLFFKTISENEVEKLLKDAT